MWTVSRVAPAASPARAADMGARRALGATRSALAVRGHRTRRRNRASAQHVIHPTRCFFDSRDSWSFDDYEFDAGLREAARTQRAFEKVEWHAREPREKVKDLLARVDAAGIWTIATTAFVLGISVSESLFDGGNGGFFVSDPIAIATLLPAWVPDAVASRAGFIDPATVASGEGTVEAIFLFEFCLRAWSEEFSFKYLRSPVALVDFAAVLPTLVGSALGGSGVLRTFRLFRLLRLLRLADDVNGG